MTEPHIIINGMELDTAQAMTVRVALSAFLLEVTAEKPTQCEMDKAYEARLTEIFKFVALTS